MKYAIVHLLLKLNFFPLPLARTFLTTVQWSILTIQGGGELSRLLCEGGAVLGGTRTSLVMKEKEVRLQVSAKKNTFKKTI